MNRWIRSAMLVCAVATSSQASGGAGSPLSGSWRGVLRRGAMESVVEFQFAQRDGAIGGAYWSPALIPVELEHVTAGSSVHFEIPRVAVFGGAVPRGSPRGAVYGGPGA